MAILFVQEVGAAGNAAASSTVIITVGTPAGGNTVVGNHLILTTGSGGSGLLSVADSKGNTWQVDVAAGPADPHSGLASAKITTQLVVGDTITVTFAGSTGAAASVQEWSGLDPVAWFDTSQNATGASAVASDSGATPTTAQADELLYGAMGSGAVTAYTPEVLSPVWNLRTTAQSTVTVRQVNPMSRVVSATGAYSAKATWTTSRAWTQLIGTYKAASGGGTPGAQYLPVRIPNKNVGPPILRRLFHVPYIPPTPAPLTEAPAGAVGITVAALQPSVIVAPTLTAPVNVTIAALQPTVLSGTVAPAGAVNVTVAALQPTVVVGAIAPAGAVGVVVAALQPSITVKANAASPAAMVVTALAGIPSTANPVFLYVGNVDAALDYLSHVKTATLKVKTNADRRNSTMDVTLIGTPAEFYSVSAGTRLITEHLIAFQWGTDMLFSGVIRSVEPIDLGKMGPPGHIALQVGCQDWTFSVTDAALDPALDSPVRTAIESDAQRIDWLVSTFCQVTVAGDLITPNSVTYVRTLVASMPAQDFTGMTVAQALDEIGKITGGTWYLDYNANAGSGIQGLPFLHYVAADAGAKALTTPFGVAATDLLTSTAHGLTAGQAIIFTELVGGAGLTANGPAYYIIASGLTANAFKVSLTAGGAAVNFTTDVTSGSWQVVTPAAFALSDTPDNATSYGYKNLRVKTETTEYRTGVLVQGGDGYSGLFGDPVGRLGVIKDDSITDAVTAGLAAEAYLQKNTVGVEGSLELYHSGLWPGQVVQIISANQLTLRGVDPDPVAVGTVFRITSLESSYDKLQAMVRYKINFGRVPRLLHTAIKDIAQQEAETVAAKVIGGVLAGYIGEVIGWTAATPPIGFLTCDGASLLRAGTYAKLFGVIGTAFGSADGTHFNLPDLRGRVVVGVDGSHALASTGGSLNHTHSGPSHTHTGPSHTHTQPTHTHTGPSHTHSTPNHVHTVASTHQHETALAATAAAEDFGRFAGSLFGTGASHSTTGTVAGTTTVASRASLLTSAESPGDTDSDGAATTGSGGTGATGADGDDTTGASGTAATGSSGTGATSSSNNEQPYVALYWAIRYA